MNNLGFKNPSIIPAVGGSWVFANKDAHRYKGIAKEGKARLNIFQGFIEEIILSVHGDCKLLKQKGFSFKSVEEETEALIQIVEIAFPVAEKHFGSYGVPITGIIFPRYDIHHTAPPPTILNFN